MPSVTCFPFHSLTYTIVFNLVLLVLAQQGSIPLIPQLEIFPAGTDPAVVGGGDSDDSDYDHSDDDSSSSTDTEDETEGRRYDKRVKIDLVTFLH